MSSSDRVRPRRLHSGLLVAVAAAAALAGCTAGPLYGDRGIAGTNAALSPAPSVQALKGRIAISEAQTRTAQIVRNDLLFRLNRGTPVAQPLYRIQLVVSGGEQGISIEPGGVATSSIYTLNGRYRILRVSDNKLISQGHRVATVPFDRTSQLFQSERALLDARQQAGELLSGELELAIAAALNGAGA